MITGDSPTCIIYRALQHEAPWVVTRFGWCTTQIPELCNLPSPQQFRHHAFHQTKQADECPFITQSLQIVEGITGFSLCDCQLHTRYANCDVTHETLLATFDSLFCLCILVELEKLCMQTLHKTPPSPTPELWTLRPSCLAMLFHIRHCVKSPVIRQLIIGTSIISPPYLLFVLCVFWRTRPSI